MASKLAFMDDFEDDSEEEVGEDADDYMENYDDIDNEASASLN